MYKNVYNLAAVKIYSYYMKNYVHDIKYVNTANFKIDDLLRPATKTVLVFDVEGCQNNEKHNDLLLPYNGYLF